MLSKWFLASLSAVGIFTNNNLLSIAPLTLASLLYSDKKERVVAEEKIPSREIEATATALVIFDGENNTYSARDEQLEVLYPELKKEIVKIVPDCQSFQYRFHTAKSNPNNPFLKMLARNGIEAIASKFGNPNIDSQMIVDLMNIKERTDVKEVMILAGDKGYCDVIEELKAAGKTVRVVGFKSSMSDEIKKVASRAYYITDFPGVCVTKKVVPLKKAKNTTQQKPKLRKTKQADAA